MNPDTDQIYLTMALEEALLSTDPSTHVGCVIVRPVEGGDADLISTGFNGFPGGLLENDRRLDREMKLKLTVHAEMRAIFNALANGRVVAGATMYIAAYQGMDAHGGPPCTRCAVHCIEAGIAEIVSYPQKAGFSKWHEDLAFSLTLLEEAGVRYREVSFPG